MSKIKKTILNSFEQLGEVLISNGTKQSAVEAKKNPERQFVTPLTDKEKELIYGVQIEHLTAEQILDKYGMYIKRRVSLLAKQKRRY